MTQFSSDSPAAVSPTADCQYRYRNSDERGEHEQKGDVIDSMTESVSMADGPSLYSSSQLSGFLKEFNGRMFNNQSELYVLPSDEREFQRLNIQHHSLVLALGGLYPCKDAIEETLTLQEGRERPTILDLGCGTGIWAVEMANKFPDCDVLGLDLAPVLLGSDDKPSNCRFEIGNIDLGLSHYHGCFDLIHARCIGSGITDYRKMMSDVEACLKPGGIVVFIDGDMTSYEEDLVTPVPVGQEEDEGGDPTKGSWFHRIRRETRSAALYNGTDCDTLDNSIDEGLWDHELIDPTTVQVASLNVPLGTWAKSNDLHTQQLLLYVGALTQQSSMGLSRSLQPMLIKYGISQETLTKWTERVDEGEYLEPEHLHVTDHGDHFCRFMNTEITAGRFRTVLRWKMTWGRRHASDCPGAATAPVERNPVPEGIDANEPPSGSPTGFKLVDIYQTREQATALANLRAQRSAHLPVPAVVRIRDAQTSKPSST